MPDTTAGLAVPLAPIEPTVLERHGKRRVDDYAWLADRDRPQTLDYLGQERAYYDALTAHTRPLQQELVAEMVHRTVATDRSVSWNSGGFVYYTQTVAGKEYEQFLRQQTEGSPAEVLLDENLLAEGSDYFALGVRAVSPDGEVLAYSVDHEGDEVYRLRFRDLRSGADLPDEVARTYYGAAWAADSRTFWYVVHDDAYRPYQVWRHRLGTAPADDVLVLQEDDERFEVHLERSRSGGYAVVHLVAKDTTEAWLIPTDDPEQPPRLVRARTLGVEYHVSHAPRPDGDVLLLVTNEEAPEFRLMSAPVFEPGSEHWTELVDEDPAERLQDADVFARHVVLTLRRDGGTLLRIVSRDGSLAVLDIHPGLPAGSIRMGRNEEYDTGVVTVVVESYTEPAAWYDVDLETGERTLLKRQEVPGYDRERYCTDRYAVEAPDGELVPVTLVWRDDTELDGTAPCLLYGYGAYEWTYDPEFDLALPSLLDRGVVFAHAHVRGGGELGRKWYVGGSLQHKQNSFTDFVAVADGLADGLVDGSALVGRGLSAGGLLVGAAYSQAPRRWAGIVAEVPFVDVVTSMLDESIPLTAQEWDEWGDPRRPDDFDWMLAYSPYDNLPAAADRPPLLVTGAVHDARVMYWEPSKWVAKLRATGSRDASVLLRMELGAGAHTGPSGRFAHLDYEAEVYAWILDRFGRSAVR